MENYKVLVKDEAESKEAQELFFELGASLGNGDKHAVLVPNIMGLAVVDDLINFVFNDVVFTDIKQCKEITISELRDLVISNRNDVGDKNIKDNTFHDLYQDSKGIVYFYHHGKAKWIESKINGNEKYMSYLKPITKEESMKREFLNKKTFEIKECCENGNVAFGCDYNDWIEIPKGMNYAYKDAFNIHFTKLEMGYRDSIIVWQRETLNDKVASAETARQADKVLKEILDGGGSAWDTQVGGDHYKKYKIQPMEFALKNNLNPLQHSVLKYVMRHEDKNGKQDLEKAKHYIDLMIEYYYGDS